MNTLQFLRIERCMDVKRLLVLIVLALIISLFAGCKKEMPYEIVKGEGAYYIVMDGAESKGFSPGLVFTDLKDMKYRMLNGYLSEEQLIMLSCFSRDEEGRILIPDLDNLWSITCPEGLYFQSVRMEAYKYMIGLKADGKPGFYVIPEDKAYFDNEMEGPTFGSKTEVEQYWDAERNAQVYLYQATDVRNGESCKIPCKKVFYTIRDGEKVFCVTERYELDVSETVPVDVEITFNDNGRVFHLYMRDFNELPTADWITQFGFCEYE